MSPAQNRLSCLRNVFHVNLAHSAISPPSPRTPPIEPTTAHRIPREIARFATALRLSKRLPAVNNARRDRPKCLRSRTTPTSPMERARQRREAKAAPPTQLRFARWVAFFGHPKVLHQSGEQHVIAFDRAAAAQTLPDRRTCFVLGQSALSPIHGDRAAALELCRSPGKPAGAHRNCQNTLHQPVPHFLSAYGAA